MIFLKYKEISTINDRFSHLKEITQDFVMLQSYR